MIDRQNHTYDERAREYEQKAKRVSDALGQRKISRARKALSRNAKSPEVAGDSIACGSD
jgi:hypothetical protein